jgi:hypothetical protein
MKILFWHYPLIQEWRRSLNKLSYSKFLNGALRAALLSKHETFTSGTISALEHNIYKSHLLAVLVPHNTSISLVDQNVILNAHVRCLFLRPKADGERYMSCCARSTFTKATIQYLYLTFVSHPIDASYNCQPLLYIFQTPRFKTSSQLRSLPVPPCV